MKTVKITLLTVVLAFAGSFSFGQIGVGAGINLANVHSKVPSEFDGDANEFNSTKMGINLGGHYDLQFNDNLGMRFGLQYSGKGSQFKLDFLGITFKSVTSLHYVQINPMLKIQAEMGRDNYFYGLIGPYLGFAVGGKVTADALGESDSESIKFGSNGDEGETNPLDFGIRPAIGMQIGTLFFQASYDLGLADISNSSDSDYGTYNRNIGITVGYVIEL